MATGSLLACGGDDAPATVDAAPTFDAPPGAVVEVTCPASPDAEVTTNGFAYEPQATTISVGEVVRFTPAPAHDVDSDDGEFHVGFGATACLRFDEAGTYPFRCTPHQFTGTVTVQ
ncbi:MAG: plastocyanin/azurin family copper-binding protein [Kofleriaceae bacterium]